MTPLATLDAGLVQAIDDTFARWPVPGFALACVVDGQHYGLCRGTRVAHADLPVTESTLFEMCSGSKAFTALALAGQVAQSRLRWDDPVREHLPGFRAHDEVLTNAVTVRDVLSHRVGLSTDLPGACGLAAGIGREAAVGRYWAFKPRLPFRAGFAYDNMGYQVAHAVALSLAGTLEAALQPALSVLGFEDTHFDCLRFHADPARAHGHLGAGDAPPARVPVWPDDAGASNTYMSARDAARWLSFNIAQHQAVGPLPAWQAAIRDMHEPHALVGPDQRRLSFNSPRSVLHTYGLGWAVTDLCGYRFLLHGGAMPGCRAWLGFMPARGIGVAVFGNASRPLTSALGHLVTEWLLGMPRQDWAAIGMKTYQGIVDKAQSGYAEMVTAAGVDAEPGGPRAGRYAQAAGGPLNIEAQPDGSLRLCFADAPFWN
ncbi:MAG TPA: serine hydrolase domain-containing protein, partial [Rubrivivax sp.]|nr:serine hydrolase domain-containing protein [Rubrivivax sp.]